jgi:hypothetical protein
VDLNAQEMCVLVEVRLVAAKCQSTYFTSDCANLLARKNSVKLLSPKFNAQLVAFRYYMVRLSSKYREGPRAVLKTMKV